MERRNYITKNITMIKMQNKKNSGKKMKKINWESFVPANKVKEKKTKDMS